MRLMLRFLPVLAFGLCSFSLLAQDEPQQPPPPRRPAPPKPPKPTGSIHGTVFCADTHRPARGAFVMVMGMPSSSGSGEAHNNGARESTGRTGMDGSFTIPNVTEGDYGIIALLPGYLSPFDQLSEDDFQGQSMPAAMTKLLGQEGTVHVTGHQTATHDITLTRGASISGQVLFSDGSPASQANLDIENINAKTSKPKPGDPDINFAALMRTMLTHQTNSTDDEGHFRISGIPPGTYRIAAISASTLDMGEGSDDEGMAMFSGLLTDRNALHVYSGDTLHKNAAKTYELRAGDNLAGVDITIPLSAFHQVRGLLSAVDGRPVNNATLTLTDTADDTLSFNAKPAADGVFSFPSVPSGTYKLAATDAHIMVIDANVPPETPLRFAPKHPASAFADGNTTLIVKDSDLLDVTFPLTEIPLPKDTNQATPPQIPGRTIEPPQ